MHLNELVQKSHEMANQKGWWDGKKRSALEIHALIHSEISEATEAVRDGAPAAYCIEKDSAGNLIRNVPLQFVTKEEIGNMKPEGEAIELVDAIIRIADWFGQNGWDLEKAVAAKMAYNANRPHRHGGKKF